MSRDIQTLRQWLLFMMIITAICATALPAVYSFTGWRTYTVGRLFMLLSISYAFALDITVLFAFWRPTDILTIFWTDALVFTFIAGASLALVILVVKMNYLKRKADNEVDEPSL